MDYAVSGNAKKIAELHNTSRETIYRWVTRWQQSFQLLDQWEQEQRQGLLSETRYQRHIKDLLTDRPRPGAPGVFTEEQKQQIVALATEEPKEADVPVTHWTPTLLRQAVIKKGIVSNISISKIWVFLKEGHIKTSSNSLLGAS